ncbi:MAG TPA: hypothetical protein PLH57_02570 [Oligoflexia bacterium]|nr:hypothetical protein [Oligoflexia bacterium]
MGDRSSSENHQSKNKLGTLGPFAPFALVVFALLPGLFHAGAAVFQYLGPSASAAVLSAPTGRDSGEHRYQDRYNIEDHRLLLVLGLDLLVRAERVVHKEFGTFTNALGRVPDLLGSSTLNYRVEVAKASPSQLLIRATGQGFRTMFDTKSVAGDRLFIDQNFEIKSNFPLPDPPKEYLRTLAKTVLFRLAREKAVTEPKPDILKIWEGVYGGYFRYERRPRAQSEGEFAWVAVGLAGSTGGETITLDESDQLIPPNLFQWVQRYRATHWIEQEVRAKLELVYLGERMSHDHTGGYVFESGDLSAYWNSLSDLASSDASYFLRGISKDSELGYRAEIAEKASGRFWTINGYGQLSENAETAVIIQQFDAARRKIASHGGLQADLGTQQSSVSGGNAGTPFIVSDPESGKNLMIEPVSPTEVNRGREKF